MDTKQKSMAVGSPRKRFRRLYIRVHRESARKRQEDGHSKAQSVLHRELIIIQNEGSYG